jgi:hypothetical protein
MTLGVELEADARPRRCGLRFFGREPGQIVEQCFERVVPFRIEEDFLEGGEALINGRAQRIELALCRIEQNCRGNLRRTGRSEGMARRLHVSFIGSEPIKHTGQAFVSSENFREQELVTQSGEPRAELIAAARFIEQWVRAQRAQRSDVLPTFATVGTSGATAFAPAPPVPVPAPTPRAFAPEPAIARAPEVATPAPVVVPPVAGPPVLPVFDDEPLDLPPFDEQVQEGAPTIAAERSSSTRVELGERRGGLFVKLAAAAGVLLVLAVGGLGVKRFMSRPATPKTGTVVLESTPAGSSVLVDGTEVGVTPLTQELPAGTHKIEFRKGDTVRKYEVDVVRGQQSVTNVDWGAKRTGLLQVESTPSGAKVQVDGKEYGVTPITVRDLVAGAHTLVLTTPEGSVRRSVTIAEDQTSQVSTAIFSGFLHVSSPIELEISEGQQIIQFDARGQALLKPGAHQIRFANRALGFVEVRRVEIKPGDVTSISVEPKVSKLSVTASLPSEVFVDGDRVGETPLNDAAIRVGTRDVVVKNASGERRRTITVLANQPVQLEFDFAAP